MTKHMFIYESWLNYHDYAMNCPQNTKLLYNICTTSVLYKYLMLYQRFVFAGWAFMTIIIFSDILWGLNFENRL